MIIHHHFDQRPEEFEARKARPIKGTKDWHGEFASQSPLNKFALCLDGGGANGSRGYVALTGNGSNEFYFEATPRWYRPRQSLDLRDTRASLYLKAIEPITVNPGYAAHLFIDDYCPDDNSYCGWYVKTPLRVGSEWTFNQIDLLNDESVWARYAADRTLDAVLGNVGFIGVMYFSGNSPRGVGARGVLGIDEFRYNIPLHESSPR